MDDYILQRASQLADETRELKQAKIIQIVTNVLLNTSREHRRKVQDDDWLIDTTRSFLHQVLEIMGVPYDDEIAQSDDPLALILERLKQHAE